MASERDHNGRCNCCWCSLGRMFQRLKDAGINNQQELDERVAQIKRQIERSRE